MMSSPDALATVTATLQHLLSTVAPGATVTTKPPSTARNGGNGEQINIFLYSINRNTTFSNNPLPGSVRNGEHAFPPLPLVLKYLITTYGANDDDISGQQLMGQAMSLLHDHPLLSRADIEGIVPDSNLHEQIERVRITQDVLTLDDMSKLWSSFQSVEYRLSTGYEVSVILIESRRTGRTPLPVLKRGERDQGVNVVARPAPSLSGLRVPKHKSAAELGDTITLLGDHLSHDYTVVRFHHFRLEDPIDLKPKPVQNESKTDGSEMAVQLPALADDPELGSKWTAGFYRLSLVVYRRDMPAWSSNAVSLLQADGNPANEDGTRPAWSSNSISLPLAPKISITAPAGRTAPAGNVAVTLTCTPQIVDDQRVALLFGDRSIVPDTIDTPNDRTAPTTLTFTVENVAARVEPYVLRLRVDGVDSIPVDFSGDVPQFDDNQKVTIT